MCRGVLDKNFTTVSILFGLITILLLLIILVSFVVLLICHQAIKTEAIIWTTVTSTVAHISFVIIYTRKISCDQRSADPACPGSAGWLVSPLLYPSRHIKTCLTQCLTPSKFAPCVRFITFLHTIHVLRLHRLSRSGVSTTDVHL